MQESCGEVNRGDVSALVSAYSELTEVMGFLQSAFPSPNLFPPTSRQDLLSYDFTLIKNAVDDFSFTTPMDLFLVSEPIGSDQRALFQKRLKQFLFLLLSRLQEVLTQWVNGGLIHFNVFSANSIVNFHIDSFESNFDNLTHFMIAQRLVSPSLISSWRSEYPAFSRNVVDSVVQLFAHDSSILSFWLESPCLSSSPSFRCIWNVLCSLGATSRSPIIMRRKSLIFKFLFYHQNSSGGSSLSGSINHRGKTNLTEGHGSCQRVLKTTYLV